MKMYRPLRISLFIYDLIRLILMISLLSLFGLSRAEGENGVFPYLFYAVPQALFPLMSLFLWIQFPAYESYVFLYIAGKIIGIVSVFAWIIASFQNILVSLAANMRETSLIVGGALILTAADALSIWGGVLLKNKLYRAGPPAAEAPAAESQAAEAPAEERDAPEGGGL